MYSNAGRKEDKENLKHWSREDDIDSDIITINCN